MPVCRCPECSTVVAWRGKRLAFTCPGDHPTRWDAPELHVDRDAARPNGEGIDAHLPEARAEADVEAGRELLAVNLAKGRQS